MILDTNGAGAGLEFDSRALRCRTAWMSESLAAAAGLAAQIRPSPESGQRPRPLPFTMAKQSPRDAATVLATYG